MDGRGFGFITFMDPKKAQQFLEVRCEGITLILDIQPVHDACVSACLSNEIIRLMAKASKPRLLFQKELVLEAISQRSCLLAVQGS